jgi:sulfate adenylyltransferase
VQSDRPTGLKRGVVVFFTGLSGSGKSTLAQALCNQLVESGGRTVTLLDGDRVRRNVSKGLTFSRRDRELNIERIAWIAAEVARHGGMAVCCPIAPFDHTRKLARSLAEEIGAAFVLVHVATPIEVCEGRDRKGLYERARRGEIDDFTGISSPYEEPDDADLVIDTSALSVPEALASVRSFLASRGFLPDES